MNSRVSLSPKFRLLGLLPLLLFLARLCYFVGIGEPGYILWICHVCNLTLALGLGLAQTEIIRVSSLWLVIGVPLWIWDMTRFGVRTITSFGTHIGGLLVALVALRRTGMGRWSWLYALAWYIIVQQLTRLLTTAELNVNMAHVVYRGWETVVSSYPVFWAGTTILAGMILWAVAAALAKAFPPKGCGTAQPQGNRVSNDERRSDTI